MNIHEFFCKWHHPGGSDLLEIEELVLRLAGDDHYEPRRPLADLRFDISATVGVDHSVPIRECVAYSTADERSIDAQLYVALDDLHKRIELRRVERREMVAHWTPTKPVLAVILGAGFSKPLGLPIAEELWQCLTNDWTHEPNQYRFFKPEDFQRFPVSEFARGEIKNIEYFLPFWDGYRQQLEDTKLRNDQWGLYRSFLEYFCHHLNRLSAQAHESPLFSQLAAWLAEARRVYDVRFITFNYDVLVERLCQQAGFSFSYLGHYPDAVPIRKLHGSVNWVISSTTQSEPFSQLLASGGRYYYWHSTLQTTTSLGEMPVIVPPSGAKQYDELFDWTWQLALGDIASADRILVIGYRFPEVDVRAWILAQQLRAKSQRIRSYVLRFDVTNPVASQDKERIHSLIGDVPIESNGWRIDHFNALLNAPAS